MAKKIAAVIGQCLFYFCLFTVAHWMLAQPWHQFSTGFCAGILFVLVVRHIAGGERDA